MIYNGHNPRINLKQYLHGHAWQNVSKYSNQFKGTSDNQTKIYDEMRICGCK